MKGRGGGMKGQEGGGEGRGGVGMGMGEGQGGREWIRVKQV